MLFHRDVVNDQENLVRHLSRRGFQSAQPYAGEAGELGRHFIDEAKRL